LESSARQVFAAMKDSGFNDFEKIPIAQPKPISALSSLKTNAALQKSGTASAIPAELGSPERKIPIASPPEYLQPAHSSHNPFSRISTAPSTLVSLNNQQRLKTGVRLRRHSQLSHSSSTNISWSIGTISVRKKQSPNQSPSSSSYLSPAQSFLMGLNNNKEVGK
jgi:hypothetical protein